MRKLCLFAAPFFIAALAGCYWLSPAALAAAGGGALALLFPAVFLLGERGREVRRRLIPILLGFGAGAIWTALWTVLFFLPAQGVVGDHTSLTATAAGYPEPNARGSQVEVELHTSGGAVRAILYLTGEEVVEPGDTLTCRGEVVSASYARGETVFWHAARGISMLIYPDGAVEVTRAEGVPLRFFPAVTRRALTDALDRCLDGRAAPLVTALLTGDTGGLDTALTQGLNQSGLAHTVAVSGMHVSFLTQMVYLLLGHRRKLAAAVMLPVLVWFVLMTGAAPSVVRAALMHGLILMAPLLGREADGFTSLAFALVLLLLVNPMAAAGVGLQLSFAAVAGQLAVSGRLFAFLSGLCPGKGRKGLPWRLLGGVRNFVWATLSSTAGALLFTVPLTALYFGRLPLIAPVANLACLWAVSFLFMGGAVVGVLGLVLTPLGQLAALPVNLLAAYFVWAAEGLGSLPFASIPLNTAYLALAFPVAYGGVLLFALLPRSRGRVRPAVALACTVLPLSAAVLFSALSAGSSALTLSVLDVGQGASAALVSGGATALVDCGGNSLDDPGGVAADYFQSLGFSRVNFLILTHCHSDHVNGLEVLFARMEVEHLFLPRVMAGDEDSLEGEVLALAAEEGCRIHWVETEEYDLTLGDTRITLYPPMGDGGANEEGLFVLAQAGDFSALLTGDANETVEAMLVRYLDLPRVDVLVAGHHGSKYATSDTLLDAVEPSAAVISVGWNSYRHPAPECLERLWRRGINIYRTDQTGTVTVTVGAG